MKHLRSIVEVRQVHNNFQIIAETKRIIRLFRYSKFKFHPSERALFERNRSGMTSKYYLLNIPLDLHKSHVLFSLFFGLCCKSLWSTERVLDLFERPRIEFAQPSNSTSAKLDESWTIKRTKWHIISKLHETLLGLLLVQSFNVIIIGFPTGMVGTTVTNIEIVKFKVLLCMIETMNEIVPDSIFSL